jgi:hypothetical protein
MQEADFVKRTSNIGSIGSADLDEFMNSLNGSMHFSDVSSIMDDDPITTASQKIAFCLAQLIGQEQSFDIAAQLLAILPPGRTTDAELEKMYASGNVAIDLDGEIKQTHQQHGELPTIRSGPLSRKTPSSVIDDETSAADNAAPWLLEAPPVVESLAKALDMQVYLTMNAPELELVPFAQTGRPDIKKIFLEMKEEAIESGDNRVAVCVSAPMKLAALCRKACIVYSDDHVRFDFHSECMEL